MTRRWRRLLSVCAMGVATPLSGCTSLLGDFSSGSSSGEGGAPESGSGTGDATVPSDGSETLGAPDGSLGSDGAGQIGDAIATSDSPAGCVSGQLICSQGCVSAADIHTCGSCAADCTLLPHVAAAGLACTAGVCAFTCLPGYAHCSANPSDGCETDLSEANHCGKCSTACSGNAPVCGPSGGTYACASGCSGSTMLCSGSCANLASDNGHCGTCTNACTGGTTCQSGACACVAPQTSCGGTCFATQTDPNHCGATCSQCAPPANGAATCNSGTCGALCNSGFATCGGTAPCAYDTNTDPAHCGPSCGTCAAPTGVCLNGGCVACTPGAQQCSGATVQQCDSTGTWQTEMTCGTGMTCSNNACVCGPAPFTMCGSACVDIYTNVNNCGGCGRACASGGICSGGTCTTCITVRCGAATCGCASAGGKCCGTACCLPP